MKKSGFTLAEVLIVLGIIGIVAELTIPALLSSYQKQVYVTQLKKAYTEGNQALKIMTADSGCADDLVCSGVFGTNSTTQSFGDTFSKYFKVVKNCGKAINKNCFATLIHTSFDHKDDGHQDIDQTAELYKFITADGMSIGVLNFADGNPALADCQNSQPDATYLKQYCGYLWVDTNGLKSPNTLGRDVFFFYISNGKGALLYPAGGKELNGQWWNQDPPYNYCQESSSNRDGVACTARIIEEGWQMNY